MRDALRLTVLTLALLALLPASASAVDRVVQNDDDSGTGSLRATIAGAAPGDTVVIPSSIGPIITVSSTIDVEKALTIRGAGPDNTRISGGNAVRVFEVALTGPGAVTFQDLTISNGRLTNVASQSGAGILHSLPNGSLTLDNVIVRDCVLSGDTYGGAAVYVENAPLTIFGSDIVDNTTTGTTDQTGGAVFARGGTVTIDHSEISRNTLNATTDDDGYTGGGGVYSTSGKITITDSSMRDNDLVIDPGGDQTVGGRSGGGAVYADTATIEVADSIFDGNTMTGSGLNGHRMGGGAMHSHNGLTLISRSVFTGNAVSLSGAPGEQFGSAGGGALFVTDDGLANEVDAVIADTTIAGNAVTNTPGRIDIVGGGGIYVNAGVYALDGVTVSGNSVNVTDTENPGYNGGGGILIDDTYAGNIAVNSTISGNSATINGGDDPTLGGGGVWQLGENGAGLWKNITVTNNTTNRHGGGFWETPGLKNTIIAGNKAAGNLTQNCAYLPNAPHLTSKGGHNLSDDATCNLIGTGDKPNTNPLLKPLANYGGRTLTHDLHPASPARNAATDCEARDQRGLARPFGPACDIGAVEGGATEEAKVEDKKPTTTTTTTTPAPPANPNEPPKLIVCGGRGTIVPQCFNQIPPPPPLIVCGPAFGTILRSCDGLGIKLGIARSKPIGLDEVFPVEVGCGPSPGRARAAVLGSIAKFCAVNLRAVTKSVAGIVAPFMATWTSAMVRPMTGVLSNLGNLANGRSSLLAGLEQFDGSLNAPNADLTALLDSARSILGDEARLRQAIAQIATAGSPSRMSSLAAITGRRFRPFVAGIGKIVDGVVKIAAPMIGNITTAFLPKKVTEDAKKTADSGWNLLGNLDDVAKAGGRAGSGGASGGDGPRARAAQVRNRALAARFARELPVASQTLVMANGTKRTVGLKLEPWARKALRRYRGKSVSLTFVAEVVRGGSVKQFTRTVKVRIAGKKRR